MGTTHGILGSPLHSSGFNFFISFVRYFVNDLNIRYSDRYMMLEQFVLGIVQGITEWLPISSEGMVVLTKTTFFSDASGLGVIIQHAIFLHLGTFFAALVYLRKDVLFLLSSTFQFQKAEEETKSMIRFLLITTVVTGIVGFGLFQLISEIDDVAVITGKSIAMLIGVLLLVTGFMQVWLHKSGQRKGDINNLESFVFGAVQGLSALPGLSRSALTVSAFLLRGFDKTYALRTSFLMSLPVLLGGNVILALGDFVWDSTMIIGLLASFVAGLLSMHFLLKVAVKMNFGYFVLAFGILTLAFALI